VSLTAHGIIVRTVVRHGGDAYILHLHYPSSQNLPTATKEHYYARNPVDDNRPHSSKLACSNRLRQAAPCSDLMVAVLYFSMDLYEFVRLNMIEYDLL
jgi:hypothetical protein